MSKLLLKKIIYYLYFPLYGILYYFSTKKLIINNILFKTDTITFLILLISCLIFALLLLYILKIYKRKYLWKSIASLVVGLCISYFSYIFTVMINFAFVMK